MADPAAGPPGDGGTSTPTRAIEEARIVAILRAADGRRLADVARVLVDHGIRAIELTLTTPGALHTLRELVSWAPSGVVFGVGSITSATEASASLEAGAQFLVSPVIVPEVIAAGRASGVPTYPGAFTPNEIHAADQLGVEAVKLFPASSLGPRYLSDVRGPMPGLRAMPTGGIAIDQVPAWLAAGAIAVGLGGPLLGDALDGGDLRALAERTARAVDAADSAP